MAWQKAPLERSAEVKARVGLDRVEQLLAQHALVVVRRQLEQVEARRRGRQALDIGDRLDAQRWPDLREAEQGRPRARRDEPQELPPLLLRERLKHTPEQLHGRVVARVPAAVGQVLAHVVHIDRRVDAADEHLQLVRAKQPQQVWVDDLGQATHKRHRRRVNLRVEPVERNQVRVVYAVAVGHGNVAPVRHQLNHAVARAAVADRKVEPKVAHVALVILHLEQVRVQLRVERRQVVQVVLPPEHAIEEEAGEWHLDQDALEQHLAKQAPDELHVLAVLGVALVRVRVRVQLVRGRRQEQAARGVERLFDERRHKLLEHAAAVHAGLRQPVLVHEADLHAVAQVLADRVELVKAVLKHVIAADGHGPPVAEHAVKLAHVYADALLEQAHARLERDHKRHALEHLDKRLVVAALLLRRRARSSGRHGAVARVRPPREHLLDQRRAERGRREVGHGNPHVVRHERPARVPLVQARKQRGDRRAQRSDRHVCASDGAALAHSHIAAQQPPDKHLDRQRQVHERQTARAGALLLLVELVVAQGAQEVVEAEHEQTEHRPESAAALARVAQQSVRAHRVLLHRRPERVRAHDTPQQADPLRPVGEDEKVEYLKRQRRPARAQRREQRGARDHAGSRERWRHGARVRQQRAQERQVARLEQHAQLRDERRVDRCERLRRLHVRVVLVVVVVFSVVVVKVVRDSALLRAPDHGQCVGRQARQQHGDERGVVGQVGIRRLGARVHERDHVGERRDRPQGLRRCRRPAELPRPQGQERRQRQPLR
eukprot:Unigene7099_Nuclearia_a/m.21765 Unigene7099_Nuclearia_a/g.21765  ORF Unigene7099_Nuclearia_a/g.21765 Unigene7099_Nuclearia_a/m.21765 type:complete len:776 (+) Unigene7099_Nuclearia_a:514-2841(+)